MVQKNRFGILVVLILGSAPVLAKEGAKRPPDFVELSTVDPSIIQEIRFAGRHNFLGHPVAGYLAPKCILTRQAAEALAAAQVELKASSLSLKVYDCYRPRSAVEEFLRWGNDPKDTKMKAEFYPHIDKAAIFSGGYISSKSQHSRGSTVDVTLVPLPPAHQATFGPKDALKACDLPQGKRFGDNSVDMGTGFDCFDPLANTSSPKLGAAQAKNREILKSLMERHGFRNMPSEWWHFTLVGEPHPREYFEFEIR